MMLRQECLGVSIDLLLHCFCRSARQVRVFGFQFGMTNLIGFRVLLLQLLIALSLLAPAAVFGQYTAAVATWDQRNCEGSAVFRAITVSSADNKASTCLTLPGGTSTPPNTQFNGGFICNRWSTPTGQTVWWLQQQNTAGCGTGNQLLGTTVGINGDFACYNLAIGSVVVDCTGSAAGKVGTTITSPAMTTNQYVPNGPTTPAASSQAALWTGSSCSTGSALMNWVSNQECASTVGINGPGVPTGASSYQVSCDSRSTASLWTLNVWTAASNGGTTSGANAACRASSTPTVQIRGSGASCSRVEPYGSIVVDCGALVPSAWVNYLSMRQDGGWSEWGTCSTVTCTQSRTCTSPFPADGGAACSGPTQQACNIDSCSNLPSSTADASGSTSSTGTGADPAKTDGSTAATAGSGSTILNSSATSTCSSLPLAALFALIMLCGVTTKMI